MLSAESWYNKNTKSLRKYVLMKSISNQWTIAEMWPPKKNNNRTYMHTVIWLLI